MRPHKPEKKRADKYEKKIKIRGTLDSVLTVLVKNPSPNLKKRKGNKKVEEK